MPMHRPSDPNNPNGPGDPDTTGGKYNAPANDPTTPYQESDAASQQAGYELVDANVSGAAAFLVVLGVSVLVVFVLAFGIGKLINMDLIRRDGPPNKWGQLAGVKPGNMESNPQMEQQQLKQMVTRFPTPRVQTDDGNMDVAAMHAREDMLLNHYSWVDSQKQVVRIPIARAMQLLAQKGLPVEGQQPQSGSLSKSPGKSAKMNQATASTAQHPMFGDASEAVTAPLTDGFARTGPELDMIEAREQRMETGSSQSLQGKAQLGNKAE